MGRRTALLICCSRHEARAIRARARLQRRSVSAYVMNIVMRGVGYEEDLFAGLREFRRIWGWKKLRVPGPRTTMHLHSSVREARRIRNEAKRGETSISGFVLHCMRRSWDVEEAYKAPTKPLHAASIKSMANSTIE